MNMAIDETLLLQAPACGLPLVRFYAWDRAAISIGYTQKYALTVKPGCALVRRPTGGGVVDHDHDFTYSVVLPASHPIYRLDRIESYRVINTAVRTGLEQARIKAALADREIARATDRAAMVCFAHPTRYDLLANGRKIAGSAQRRTSQGILHQGSIHFGTPLPLPRPAMARALIDGFKISLHLTFKEFTATIAAVKAALPLAQAQYETEAWNQRR